MRALKPLLWLLACLVVLSACQQRDEYWTGDDGSGVNYTQFPINWVELRDGNGYPMGGLGGFNGLKEEQVGLYYTGTSGECCIRYPRTWKEGMKVSVRWERERCGQYAKPSDCGNNVYQAEVLVQEYGGGSYGFFVQFLPSDRVRIFVSSERYWENEERKYPKGQKQKLPGLSDAEDGFTAQGVLDAAATAELDKDFESRMAIRAAQEAALARLTPAQRQARDEEIRKENEKTERFNEGVQILISCLNALAQSGVDITGENRAKVCVAERAICKKKIENVFSKEDETWCP